MANKLSTFFKNLFSRTKTIEEVGRKQGQPIFSFHPKTGIIREETGTWLVAAPNLRKAAKHFQKEHEKRTGIKSIVKNATTTTD